MKTANGILSTALSLGLILSPVASIGAEDASKETVSPQRVKVGTGTTAGQTDYGSTLKAGYIITGIATAALLAVVLESALDGKKDVPAPDVPDNGDGGPPTTPPTTPPATPPATTTTATGTGTGN